MKSVPAHATVLGLIHKVIPHNCVLDMVVMVPISYSNNVTTREHARLNGFFVEDGNARKIKCVLTIKPCFLSFQHLFKTQLFFHYLSYSGLLIKPHPQEATLFGQIASCILG